MQRNLLHSGNRLVSFRILSDVCAVMNQLVRSISFAFDLDNCNSAQSASPRRRRTVALLSWAGGLPLGSNRSYCVKFYDILLKLGG